MFYDVSGLCDLAHNLEKTNMTADELWEHSGIVGKYEAWSFGDDPDQLAALVKAGKKTATCSALIFYELEDEEMPQAGEYSIILDSVEHAVCIIRTTNVFVTTFEAVTEELAKKEGEGDLSLEYWRSVHRRFFSTELEKINRQFDEKLELVFEEFEVVG